MKKFFLCNMKNHLLFKTLIEQLQPIVQYTRNFNIADSLLPSLKNRMFQGHIKFCICVCIAYMGYRGNLTTFKLAQK